MPQKKKIGIVKTKKKKKWKDETKECVWRYRFRFSFDFLIWESTQPRMEGRKE